MEYDLEERTAKFAESVIALVTLAKKTPVTAPVVSQLVRAATSVGANYYEANGASSPKDFRNKIYICKKEIKETGYWLRMLIAAEPAIVDKIKAVRSEARELTLIFTKIVNTIDRKEKKV